MERTSACHKRLIDSVNRSLLHDRLRQLAAPKHKTPRLPNLNTFAGLRHLGARLIREAMREERPLDDCSRLMHMLRVQSELILATKLESQVGDLEKVITEARLPNNFYKLAEIRKAA